MGVDAAAAATCGGPGQVSISKSISKSGIPDEKFRFIGQICRVEPPAALSARQKAALVDNFQG
jgi:hypothetical protein